MSGPKCRKPAAVPLKSPKAKDPLRSVKIEAEYLREKLQKSVIDNPQAAKKAALLIGLWIEGKTAKRKKAA
ncbi:MAG TPA: hypothetical protein VIH99_11040 [Bdellovibrionota bacterium]|jgi:hypothetical protein